MGNNDQWMSPWERSAYIDSAAGREAYLRSAFAPAQPSAGQIAGAAFTAALGGWSGGQIRRGFGKKRAQREAARQENEYWANCWSQWSAFDATVREMVTDIGDLLDEWDEHDSARAKAYARYRASFDGLMQQVWAAIEAHDEVALTAAKALIDAKPIDRLYSRFYEN